jgi:hypothetical protein
MTQSKANQTAADIPSVLTEGTTVSSGAINSALTAMEQDGTLAKVRAPWFSSGTSP